MRIPYRASNFSLPYISMNGYGDLSCSWWDLMRAAITVGRQGWRDVLKHGRYSYLEIIYRATMIRANMDQSSTISPYDFLVKTPVYRNLDLSEKSAVSYFTGLTMAKLFSEKLLRVPWLAHVDLLKNIWFSSANRPDLIGMNFNQDWIVVEAKGRSGRFSAETMLKAKKQSPIACHD